jgi:hypothetical protein
MNAFYEHHQNSIRFGYRCFDRILLNGLIQPFQQPERVMGFFSQYRNQYPVSRDVLREIADQFHHWVKNRSEKWGAPILDAPAGRRDEFVDPYFRHAQPDQLAVILKARETARILTAIWNKRSSIAIISFSIGALPLMPWASDSWTPTAPSVSPTRSPSSLAARSPNTIAVSCKLYSRTSIYPIPSFAVTMAMASSNSTSAIISCSAPSRPPTMLPTTPSTKPSTSFPNFDKAFLHRRQLPQGSAGHSRNLCRSRPAPPTQPTHGLPQRQTDSWSKLDHPRQLALMHALLRFSHIAAESTFTTAELHPQTADALGCSTADYHLSSLRYDLSKLRAKGLVEKIPHSRRYRLLPNGYRICLVFLKLFERIYAPLTAGLLRPFPADNQLQQQRLSQLDRLYQKVNGNSRGGVSREGGEFPSQRRLCQTID